MQQFLDTLLGAASFVPHGYCLLWRPDLVAMHAGADGLIAASYLSIPMALAVFATQRRDIGFSWIVWLFAAFIIACGFTHLIGLVTLWWPIYGFQGLIKVATAVISVVTAILIWPLLRKAIAYPSPRQVEENNKELARLVQEKDRMLRELETARKELSQHRNFLRAVFDNVSDGIVACAGPERIALSNQPAKAAFGDGFDRMTVDQWLSSTTRVEPDGSAPIPVEQDPLKLALAGNHVRDREMLIVDATSRRERLIVANAQPMKIADVGTPGAVLTFHDVTEERRTEEKLRQKQKFQAIGQLTGGVAHDFNNLLSTILGGLQLLETKVPADHPAHKYIDICLRATRSGEALTKQLLAYARQQRLQPEPITIGDFLDETEELVRRILPESIELEMDVQDSGSIVACDRSQLQAAILNLLVNARDAIGDASNGHIVIAARLLSLSDDTARLVDDLPPGDYVEFSIDDNGPGMAENTVKKAFEPFFTTKTRGHGTGMGLSMVDGFGRQSGGSFALFSALGEGTSAKLYLPATNAGHSTEAISEGEPSTLQGDGQCILVVEDEEDLLEIAVELLETMNYRPLGTTRPARALELLKSRQPFDLLLTDVVMPGGMSGFELAEEAQRIRPCLKVIFVTGFAREFRDRKPIDSALITKPYSREILAKTLDRELSEAS